MSCPRRSASDRPRSERRRRWSTHPDLSGQPTARRWRLRRPRRRLPLQRKGNHGVLDGPPKTLSSRFQALSHLQPAEPPRSAESGRERLPAPAAPAAAAEPLFLPQSGGTAVQNRSIGTLAGRAQARYPLATVQCTNSPATDVLLRHFGPGHRAGHAMQIALFQPDIPREHRHDFPAVRMPGRGRPYSSSRRDFPSPTGISAGQAWIISTRSAWCGTTHGRNSSNGARKRGIAWSCLRPRGAGSAICVTERRRHPAIRTRVRRRHRRRRRGGGRAAGNPDH